MEINICKKDSEEVVHEQFRFQFDNGTTLMQLSEAIASYLYIDRQFQNLFCADGKSLSNYFSSDSLVQIGLKDRDTITVKHIKLPLWDSLLIAFEDFKNTNIEEFKKTLYQDAIQLQAALKECKFTVSYPRHYPNYNKINKAISTYYDRTRGAIEKSTKKYFQNLYREIHPKVTFGSRIEGSRRGCIAYVEVNGETTKYHIKTHHGGGARDSNTREDLDLKELFVYMFLEKLGVGAKIHFIPNDFGSRWILYIGSREIPNFKTIKDLELQSQNLLKHAKALVQMLSLYTILNMGDHHADNMGVDEKGCPYIIDFLLIERGSIDVKTCFYDKVRHAEEMNKVLGTLTFLEKVRIAKDYFKEKDVVGALTTETLNFFLDNKMKFVKDQQKTNDLKIYVEKIKENVLMFDEFQLEDAL